MHPEASVTKVHFSATPESPKQPSRTIWPLAAGGFGELSLLRQLARQANEPIRNKTERGMELRSRIIFDKNNRITSFSIISSNIY
jgi:hypothetical protein